MTGEELWHYCAGLLGTDAYNAIWGAQMSRTRVPHVPFPDNRRDFAKVVDIGRRLVAAARGQNLVPSGVKCNQPVSAARLPAFSASCWDRTNDTLTLGGGSFSGVTAAIWQHEVSGYRTLQRWIAARSSTVRGRPSSPLDDEAPSGWTFTADLIRVCDQIATLNSLVAAARDACRRIDHTRPSPP